MSKKIIFKGNPEGCYLPFEPDLLQLDLQEPNTTELPSDSRMKQIEELAKLSLKETKDFCFDSFSESDWIELCLMNSSFLYHPESFLLDDEIRQTILLMEYFKKKNIRIGLSTAANLCKRNKESYSIDAFNIETALPIRNLVITNAEIEEALTPPRYQSCNF